MHSERVKYWLSVGAQMSGRVGWLCGQLGIIPKPPQRKAVKNLLPKEILKLTKKPNK